MFWTVALFYAGVGLSFAVPFVLFWSGRIDSAAQHGSWGFRLAILPGTIALWPLMALKTLRVLRFSYASPDPERPVSPRMQRQIHGIAFMALAAVVPILCAAALLSRPGIEFSVAEQLQPAPFSGIAPLELPAPDGLPMKAALRTDGNSYQVDLEVSQPLDEPIVALYWSPGTGIQSLAGESTFLGSVWGPSRLLFTLPVEGRFAPGTLTFIALTGNQRALGAIPVSLR